MISILTHNKQQLCLRRTRCGLTTAACRACIQHCVGKILWCSMCFTLGEVAATYSCPDIQHGILCCCCISTHSGLRFVQGFGLCRQRIRLDACMPACTAAVHVSCVHLTDRLQTEPAGITGCSYFTYEAVTPLAVCKCRRKSWRQSWMLPS